MKESEIKIALVRWLLDRLAAEEVIASELQFSNALNRADLVVSSPITLISYEIKSFYDDFRRFEHQQDAYRAAFLESYLVVPSELLQESREYLLRATGILVVEEGGNVNIFRKARAKRRLARNQALAWLRESDRRRLGLSEVGRSDALTEHELTGFALQAIYDRLKPRFDAFRAELGKSFTSDDLGMLSLPLRIR